ncbi:hypothetical protein BDA99DRAFT_602595 [Phascolomyces articulosus]|uniref:Actin-like ATPase domain-containing protein n=1 Tax=Phascolomyces articulosus TaxID=60185 RepID=A0AAD5PH90_9FUNG|nr:hypothetical protein BDA99DRAFT_602595 [Phascolomyces articulosus]
MFQANQQQNSIDYKVVVAYDFGTTFSGAAYAFTSTPAEVFHIQRWPHKAGKFYPKVPTLSVYPLRNPQQQQQTGQSTLSHWGHSAIKKMLDPQARKKNVLLSMFKLQLDESLNLPPLENGLTPIQAVADYLAELHKHTMEELSVAFADIYSPDTFRYCLTVPALWSDRAKYLMRQASIQAGLITRSDPFDRLVLISEPEAAALYCEQTMGNQVQFQDNDRLMVCDVGGGTADLIVFQVNFTDNADKRILKEVTKGIGESCGGVFLDERFYELLQRKLGMRAMNKLKAREVSDLMDTFIDKIKPAFDGLNDHYVTLPRSVALNDLPTVLCANDPGISEEGIIRFSSRELKENVFDPIVDKILSLIRLQYHQIPDGRLNYLFLVGGFGSSRYLYKKIQSAFQSTGVKQIVCLAEHAALAVVRGAAYYGLNPHIVVSRVSRRTYGINYTAPFDNRIDPLSKRIVRPDGTIRCKNRFFTFVKKNEELPIDHCIREDFFVYYGTQKSINLVLYATENDTVPRYHDEPGVHQVATITIPIPTIPGMRIKERLDHDVRMYFGSTEIRMEADFGTGIIYDVNCVFDAIDNYGS